MSEDRADDPLTCTSRPSLVESSNARERSEPKEREAARVSREIDQSIQEARDTFERRRQAVKVLLLGQFTLTVLAQRTR